ncbi:ATP synthase F1 subunit epsilon [Candidatus Falkowbacteria bacterium CG_4_10_14_0_2_um_filter_41_15]|uniref:ATP synthase epsilon chain n=2 Tax=Candidatus Falkowiibacteriota TaxID=1752728 RepID=A0A1J4T898_9BACT|nr:MAG: ATP synthase F1 subunit epsilon [Candidatus Falkowbacteria bacterium CG1_02_41_21]PJA10598.1 MAG: ATP synthase F1 subunit epsilon [Candidatus Falkowbacteria bacterium CG_4_10_14_0_2_um_filter_41_15]
MASDKKTIKFEIVTPERIVLKEEALQVTIPTQSGEITILPDHIPLVSILSPGVIELKKSTGENEVISVSGGFVEVLKNKIVILADTAELAVELDEKRIEEARQKAEEMKKWKDIDAIQFAEISGLIEKQLARSKAVKRWRNLRNIK